MSILDFEAKKNARVDEKMLAFSKVLDRAYRSILNTPQVNLVNIVGFSAERLARFISVAPSQYRDKLLAVAITTLQKYYKPESK